MTGWDAVFRLAAVEKNRGNVSAAAREIGMSKITLQDWISQNKKRRAWYNRLKRRRRWKEEGGQGPISEQRALARMAALRKHEGNIAATAREVHKAKATIWQWVKRDPERKRLHARLVRERRRKKKR